MGTRYLQTANELNAENHVLPEMASAEDLKDMEQPAGGERGPPARKIVSCLHVEAEGRRLRPITDYDEWPTTFSSCGSVLIKAIPI